MDRAVFSDENAPAVLLAQIDEHRVARLDCLAMAKTVGLGKDEDSRMLEAFRHGGRDGFVNPAWIERAVGPRADPDGQADDDHNKGDPRPFQNAAK